MSREMMDFMKEFSIFFVGKNEVFLCGCEWCFIMSYYKKRRMFLVLFYLWLLCLYKFVCDVFCLLFEGGSFSFVLMLIKL